MTFRTAEGLGSSTDRRLAIRYNRRVMMNVDAGLTMELISCRCVTDRNQLRSSQIDRVRRHQAHAPMSQYTMNLMSALSDHTISLTPFINVSRKSQKLRKTTPVFQLWRTTFAEKTRSRATAARRLAIGYRGYVGSAAAMIARPRRGAPLWDLQAAEAA